VYAAAPPADHCALPDNTDTNSSTGGSHHPQRSPSEERAHRERHGRRGSGRPRRTTPTVLQRTP